MQEYVVAWLDTLTYEKKRIENYLIHDRFQETARWKNQTLKETTLNRTWREYNKPKTDTSPSCPYQ